MSWRKSAFNEVNDWALSIYLKIKIVRDVTLRRPCIYIFEKCISNVTKTSAKIIFIAVVLKVYSSYGLLGDAHFSEMIGGRMH